MTTFTETKDSVTVLPDTVGKKWLFVCRNDCETILLEEITAIFKKSRLPFDVANSTRTQNGMILLSNLDETSEALLDLTELVFERQRLPEVRSLQVESIKTCAQTIIQDHFPKVDQTDLPWTLHVFTPDVEECKLLGSRVRLIESAILEKLKKRFGRMFRRYQLTQTLQGKEHYLIVQVCMDRVDHVYLSIHQKTPLIHAYPGGEQRMPFDSKSPSRSYLKLFEAVSRMPERPMPGQTAIDLGAAPGGWTYYLLKQGCKVTAVDNGSLKIPNIASLPGILSVVKTDGMLFAPAEKEYDWLCCDMLRPPRQTLELLAKWIEHGWMKSFVVNVKLPQKNPVAMLQEARDFLAEQNLAFLKIKQLYHDRDEVTIMGMVER